MRTLLSAVCFVCLLAAADNCPSQEETTTKFYGVMDAKTRVFRFSIDVNEDQATLTSLDEGSRQFKLDEFKLTDDEFSFELKASQATYESKFDEESGKYLGQWSQGGNKLDLNLTRVEKIPEQQAVEIWEGEFKTPFQKLKLRFKVFDEKAPHRVLMDSVTQRVGGLTGEMKSEGDSVEFSIPGVRGKFTGVRSKDGKTLTGKWNQVVDYDLELKKVEGQTAVEPDPAPRRPQTPQGPFPYSSVELAIRNTQDNITLAGTLTVPIAGKKATHPCAILISGSGPQDRDETILDHKPFWVLADHLSRNGIAVFRFDDRGTAKSTGDHDQATSQDFARDVNAIIDQLKQHPGIDRSKIGLIGHSEGGLIAPMVAKQRNETNESNVAFLVLLAGPGVNGEKILRNQLKLVLRAAGESEEGIDKASRLQNLLLEFVKSLDDEPSAEQLEAIFDKVIEMTPELESNREGVKNRVKAELDRLNSPWMKFFMKHEPGPVLAAVKCPVLVLNGEKDTQVDPDLNVPAIEKAFRKAGKKNFETVVFPNLNHLFQTSQTGGVGEYSSIEETIAPVVLKKIASWIQQL